MELFLACLMIIYGGLEFKGYWRLGQRSISEGGESGFKEDTEKSNKRVSRYKIN